MACCGGSKNNYLNGEELLKKLRNIEEFDEKIELKLDRFECKFRENGKWDNNFNGEISHNYEKYDEEIENLKGKLLEKENECQELEKEYLAKVVRLLYMAQTHCSIKKENDKLFEDYNIKEGNKRIDDSQMLPA